MKRVGRAVKRVPWVLWVVIAVAGFVIFLNVAFSGTRVAIVGAGWLKHLEGIEAPDGLRYSVEVLAREPLSQTRERMMDAIDVHPVAIVLGVDGSNIRSMEDEEEALEVLRAVSKRAVSLAIVTVITSPWAPSDEATARMRVVWREELCVGDSFLLCLDLAPFTDDPDATREAVAVATLDAVARFEDWRAATQGRSAD